MERNSSSCVQENRKFPSIRSDYSPWYTTDTGRHDDPVLTESTAAPCRHALQYSVEHPTTPSLNDAQRNSRNDTTSEKKKTLWSTKDLKNATKLPLILNMKEKTYYSDDCTQELINQNNKTLSKENTKYSIPKLSKRSNTDSFTETRSVKINVKVIQFPGRFFTGYSSRSVSRENNAVSVYYGSMFRPNKILKSAGRLRLFDC